MKPPPPIFHRRGVIRFVTDRATDISDATRPSDPPPDDARCEVVPAAADSVTAAETRGWFPAKWRPSEAACAALADTCNRYRAYSPDYPATLRGKYLNHVRELSLTASKLRRDLEMLLETVAGDSKWAGVASKTLGADTAPLRDGLRAFLDLYPPPPSHRLLAPWLPVVRELAPVVADMLRSAGMPNPSVTSRNGPAGKVLSRMLLRALGIKASGRAVADALAWGDGTKNPL
jgi:hypothetical protein